MYADRVLEISETTGTGAMTLDGPETGFQSFASGIGNNNECFYVITNTTVLSEWEVGQGTVSNGTLVRDEVLSSSNSDELVDFSVGVKEVRVTIPASQVTVAVYE